MEIDIYKALFFSAIGVIGWFVRCLIADLKDLESKVGNNSTTIAVLKSDFGNFEKKIDKMSENIDEISRYIRDLNIKHHE